MRRQFQSVTRLGTVFLFTSVLILGCASPEDPPPPTFPSPPSPPPVVEATDGTPMPILGIRLEAFTGAEQIRIQFPGAAVMHLGEESLNLEDPDGLPLAEVHVAALPEGFNIGGQVFETREVAFACEGDADSGVVVARTLPDGTEKTATILGGVSLTLPDDVTDPGLWVIARVGLEEYVCGALLGEMPASFHDEALSAQAVAIRTYGLYQYITNEDRGNGRWPYDVVDSVQDLRYLGPASRTPETDAIVAKTRGLVMAYQGEEDAEPRLFLPYFHSTSGGATTSAWQVFGTFRDVPCLQGVAVDACSHSSMYRWETTFDWAAAREALVERGIASPALGERLATIRGEEPDASGRPTIIAITTTDGEGINVSSSRFRLAVGPGRDVLPSTLCTFANDGNTITASGKGWGHGVGLCQYGADGLATEGYSAREILATYYPDCTLLQQYE